MAFNWQTFKTRSLTAAIFVVVMLAGLLTNRWLFFILFSVIHYGCWWEYLKLIDKIYNVSNSRFNRMLLMNVGYGLFWLIAFRRHETEHLGFKLGSALITIAGVLLCLLVAGVVLFFAFNKTSLKAKGMSLGGLPYISLSLGLMMTLYAKADVYPEYRFTTDIRVRDSVFVVVPYFYPLAIIASLWINDTMAYIVGSLIGKTQMTKISPKKTWEGTVGGIILSALVIFSLATFVFHLGILSYPLAIIAILASITGTLGDLFESKLKRMAGVKDSGSIMPGHGGFLDRFDSLLVATPFVWLYVYFLMR